MTVHIEDRLRAAAPRLRAPLPGLPQLLKALADEGICFDELVAVLQHHPGIAARLLAVANSAWCGNSVPVTSLHSACTRLGLRLIRSISVSIAVSAPFDVLKCPSFDPVRFWSTCMLVADAAESLAACCTDGGAIEARSVHTAGLLHSIGLLWLADENPAELTRALEIASGEESMSLDEALRGVIGLEVRQVSGLLLSAWRLPETLITMIEHHRDPRHAGHEWPSAALLGGAADIVAALGQGRECPDTSPGLDRLGISPDSYQRVFASTELEVDRVRELASEFGRF